MANALIASVLRLRKAAAAGLIILVWAFAVTPVNAQSLSGPNDPNRIDQRFQQPPVPQSKPEVEFPEPEQAPPPERANAIHFTLTGIMIEGVTVYTEDDLRPLYADLLNHAISLADLYKLRDAITTKYRNDGYVLAQAVIPAQKLNSGGGIARIRVLEGYVKKIDFEGDFTDLRGLLRDYANKIMASRPLRASVLERYVQLANDLPGVVARLVIRPAPGQATAGTDMTFIIERKPVDARVTLDNRGSRSIGPLQIQSSANLNSPVGLMDRTTVTAITVPHINELRYFDVAHVEQLDSDGTTMTVGGRNSYSEPGDTVRQFQVKSRGTTVHVDFAHPLIRSRAETWRVDADFTLRNSRTNSFGEQLSDDRVRTATIGTQYDFADGWQGANLIQFAVSHGFNVLNATPTGSPDLSRADGRSDFTKYVASLTRDQPLSEQFSLTAGLDGQFSTVPLLASEQYGVGGQIYGRAFDSSELVGDRGWATKLELQYMPDFEVPTIKYSQFYTWVDYGAVFNFIATPIRGWQDLASTGVGVRFGVTDSVAGSFELAKPMLRGAGTINPHDVRGFFSLTARY